MSGDLHAPARRSALRLVAGAMIAAVTLAACDAATHGADPPRSGSATGPSGSATRPAASAHRAARARAIPTVVHLTPPRSRLAGQLIMRRIPSTTGFLTRPAYIYLPPVVREHPGRHVPVLEMLHGTPGQPSDWLTRGDLRATMDRFAAKHHGLAPIVVMPDLNGAEHADSECIRTASGANVENYLTRDVVRYVRTHYARVVGTSPWWIAGLSEGGLCAATLSLRHPGTYSAFGDLSGLAVPTVDHVTPARSDELLFGGNATARLEHSPIWLLQHRHYAHLRGWFECGSSDGKVLRAQAAVVAAARAAGLPVRASMLPGRHSWIVWRRSLQQMLPWLWGAGPK